MAWRKKTRKISFRNNAQLPTLRPDDISRFYNLFDENENKKKGSSELPRSREKSRFIVFWGGKGFIFLHFSSRQLHVQIYLNPERRKIRF